MVYQERNTWASLIVTAAALVVYIVVTLQAAAGRALTEVDWVPIMLWTIGASIVASILLSIVWGMLAAGRDPEGVGRSDQRDRDIERAGDRVGQAFLVLGGLGAIALCAVEADAFWIANAVFFGFALSAIAGGMARVIMYRRGLA
jgi:MFS family permease